MKPPVRWTAMRCISGPSQAKGSDALSVTPHLPAPPRPACSPFSLCRKPPHNLIPALPPSALPTPPRERHLSRLPPLCAD
eukprot:scaffold12858_cov89-Isochrysis_galbana.AAC.2